MDGSNMILVRYQSKYRVWSHIFILTFYCAINATLFFKPTIDLLYLNDFSALLQGFFLRKYLFCFLSSNFMCRAALNRMQNTFCPRYACTCGVYFLVFTAYVYYLIGVKMWKITSVHQILPNFISIIDDLIQDVVVQLPLAYSICFLCTALLVVPTPILGVYMVREMYFEYKYPTVGYVIWDMNGPRRL